VREKEKQREQREQRTENRENKEKELLTFNMKKKYFFHYDLVLGERGNY